MSVSGNSPSYSQRLIRSQKLRQATFILPKTGQRLRGLVQLRNSSGNSNGHANDEERRGLLSGELPSAPEGFIPRVRGKLREQWISLREFLTSDLGVGVLKCSLAYLLGSLATFVPLLTALLGHQDSKHMVATITVYFHPARSQGSMFKALICAFLAFIYTAFVSITSMCVEMLFQDTLNLVPLGHAIVLIVFCGGGLGFIGWTKQRLSDPLVNVACSLASLSTISVLTKEGAVQAGDLSFAKISQVLKMIVMGVTTTMAVSLLIFPISARKNLRSGLKGATESMATMLALITESFLSGSEEDLLAAEFVDAATHYKKAYTQLDTLIHEARIEHYARGTEKQYRLEKNLVRWVQDQNMGGLRSAASLQFQLLKQTKPVKPAQPQGVEVHQHRIERPMSPWSIPEDRPFLEPIEERPEEENAETELLRPALGRRQTSESEVSILPADIFAIFIEHLGPSMRSLAFTFKEILREIPFGPAPHYKVSVDSRFRTSLDRALELYVASREEALKTIYRQKEIFRIKGLEIEADLEEVAASCGHFSFSLLEFGEQLKELLTILDDLQLESEERPSGRSWNWLKFWRKGDLERRKKFSDQPLIETSPMASAISLPRPLSHSPDTESDFSKLKKPSAKSRLGYQIWKSLRVFRRDDMKFAIKVGTGAALYALPSFIPSTRPFYSHWRGEWGLLSYMLVCSMTIGSSNTTGYARFLGTCLGAGCAIFSWYITAGNAYGLAILGLLMATWTSYIIIVKRQGPMGRFIMLTYNLSVLYAYSLTQQDGQDDQDEGGESPVIAEIALHRVVAVFSGCIWGIIITRLIWPISARKRLKDGLALLWLRMSIIWKSGPLSATQSLKQPTEFMSVRDKLELQRFLTHLESLQVSARSEFRLKQAFPDAVYTRLLTHTRSMVDSFMAINLELARNMTSSEGELAILDYTVPERRNLSSRISHLLSFMASSMKLEYPLNDNLPNVEHTRDRLLARLYHYRKDSEVSRLSTDEDYSLLYAYVLVTGQLSKEIMVISDEIGRLFGVLDEDAVKLYP